MKYLSEEVNLEKKYINHSIKAMYILRLDGLIQQNPQPYVQQKHQITAQLSVTTLIQSNHDPSLIPCVPRM